MDIGGRRKQLALLGIVASAAFLAFWLLRPARSSGPCDVVSGPTALPALPEASGLAVSRRDPRVLWSHNDSDNAEVLFALDTAGRLLGQVRVPAPMRDWEDVSAARCPSGPCLYLADIGDNGRRRMRIEIYRVPEPKLDTAETAPPETFRAIYADGPHNAEALFVIGETPYIVTRDRTGGIYRGRVSAGDARSLTFERIGELGLEAVTDAEASPDERSVVVRTSHEAVFYRADDFTAGRTPAPFLRVPIDGLREPQGEGVALDRDMLYLSSEGGTWNHAGRLVSLRCELPE